MDFQSLSPYVRVANDSVVQPSRSLRERVIFDYELIFIKSGEVDFTVDGVVYACKPGDIIFLGPNVPHSAQIRGKTPIVQPHVHFDLFYQPDSPDVKVSFKPLRELTPEELQWFRPPLSIPEIGAPPVVLRIEKPGVFEHKLYALIREFDSYLPYSEIAVQGLFLELWTHYLRELYLQKNEIVRSTVRMLESVREYLDANLDRDVSLDELAEYAHLNKYYIGHLFRKMYGLPPIKYHQTARVNRAKELVKFTDLPIGQIAEQMGYLNIGSFSRTFRTIENVPPTFYR